MSAGFEDRLRSGFPDYTPAEKAVASYLLAHLPRLPFETAATVAEAVGVSQMTVGRFLKARGYSGFSEVKQELRDGSLASPVLISDRVARLRDGAAGDRLKDSFDAEVEALLGVYEAVGTAVWTRVTEHLSRAAKVGIAGFQTLEGLASTFQQRLSYLRPEAILLDGRDGTFGELLEPTVPSPGAFLFMIEMRRCTKSARLLAEAAASRDIPVAILCDAHCGWAHEVTENVLTVSTETRLFWDSQTPLICALGLLLDETARRLGPRVAERTRHLAGLQDEFGCFE